MFLVVVDAYSKWLEVAIVSSATSSNTIEKNEDNVCNTQNTRLDFVG
jgi:hypothetical protein